MNASTPLPAPGWYADPAAPAAALRYWDGTAWTAHVHPVAGAGAGIAGGPAPDAGAVAPAEAAAPEAAAPAPTEPSAVAETPVPDVAVPSAGGTQIAEERAVEAQTAAAQQPESRTTAEVPPAEPDGRRADPYAASSPYGQPSQAMPVPPAFVPPGASPRPSAPWAPTGHGHPTPDPYRPQQPGPGPGAPRSRKGLWIGLGIGGGVFLLLVIGVIVAVFAFLNAVRDAMPAIPDVSTFGGEEPLPEEEGIPAYPAPELDGAPVALGEAFTVANAYGSDWEITVTEFLPDATDQALTLYDGRIVAFAVEATNLGAEASDPYFGLNATFIASDGLEYPGWSHLQPDLIDVDEVGAGETARFHLSFEIPVELSDSGTLLVYDGYWEAFTPVEAR